MKVFTSKKNSRSDFFFILCCTLCMLLAPEIGGVPRLPLFPAPEVSLSSISEGAASSSSTMPSVFREALKNPAYQDQISQDLLLHLASSPKSDQLECSKNAKAAEKLDLGSRLEIVNPVEKAKAEDVNFPKNAFRLQVWGKNDVNWAAVGEEESQTLIKQILDKTSADTKGAQKIADKYSAAVYAGNYGVIMDNEADDLSYLAMNFEDKTLPKFIITYGGFVELRYQATLKFVEAACALHDIPKEKMPKVYRGFPHFSTKADRARAYDQEEGSKYINEEDRVKYIKESIALEERLQGDEPNTWKPDAWLDPIFKQGLDAAAEMIDQENYSAFAVLTSPALLAHLVRQKPTRVRKFAVTMASPYSYIMNDKGVHYIDTYNARLEISLTNELLKSGVEFLGVGGGTAKTRGLRTLHDYKLGREGEKLYPDVGLRHLEDVISPDSPFEMFKIISFAGHNVSVAKWRDWDERLAELSEFLKLEELPRSGLKELRERSPGVVKLLKEKAERARKVQEEKTSAAMAARSGDTEMEDVSVTEQTAQAADSKKEKKENELPEAGKWELDRLINIWRVWYLYGDRVRWQGPSADLHGLVTIQPYSKGILGAVRYAVEDWPVKLDKEGKPGREKLAKFVVSDNSNHYAISQMDFQVIIEPFQRMLVKYFNKKQEILALQSSHGM